MSHQPHNSSSALSFIVGAGIGIAAGVLLAPKKGQDTRDQIKAKVKETHAKTMEKLNQERTMVQDQADKVKTKASEVVSDAEHKVASSRKAIHEKVEEVKARADQKSLNDAYTKKQS